MAKSKAKPGKGWYKDDYFTWLVPRTNPLQIRAEEEKKSLGMNNGEYIKHVLRERFQLAEKKGNKSVV